MGLDFNYIFAVTGVECSSTFFFYLLSIKNFQSFDRFDFVSLIFFLKQINVVVLAVILWSVGGEMRIQCCILAPPNFTYSFLADNSSPVLDDLGPRETILNLYSEGIFKKSFRRWRRIQS